MASLAPSPTSLKPGAAAQNQAFALTTLTSLFFMWGFLTALNDALIPHLKALFTLSYGQVMLVQFCFFTAYALTSLPSGMLVERIGYKRGIVLGLLTAGVGCLMFYPAAGHRSYPMFLGALFILATGITLLQVAANPYVAILGRPETASSRLNLTQAFNSLGTTIAPVFGSLVILAVALKSGAELGALNPQQLADYHRSQAQAVQIPYLWLAAALVLIAITFALIRLPHIDAGDNAAGTADGGYHDLHASAWGYRHLVLGALAIFLYVGAEVSIGSFLVNYFAEPAIGGLSLAAASKIVAYYWGGAMAGRFIGAYFTKIVRPSRCLTFNALVAGALVVISMLTLGHLAMGAIILVGLFNSIMFPTIFTLAIDGLGKHTGQASGILCTAIVGGALIPVVQGVIADHIGIHHAFVIPVLCYLYIAYYGLKGYRRAGAPA